MPRPPKPAAERKRARAGKPIAPPVLQSSRWSRAEELLADLLPTGDVCETIMLEFGVSRSTAMGDIRAARDRWAAESAKERPAKRAEMHARVRRIERLALRKGDLPTALKALSLASDLDGLRQKGDEPATGALTPEQEEALREALGKRPA
jgi:hypothetical protein